MGDQYDDTKPHKCQDAASGDASKVTLHPSAATNLGTLASIDEDASICGKGMRLLSTRAVLSREFSAVANLPFRSAMEVPS